MKETNDGIRDGQAKAGLTAGGIGRRAFIGAGAAAIAGAVVGGVGGVAQAAASDARVTAGVVSGKSEGALFHRLRFEGEKVIPGDSVRVRQAEIRMISVVGGKYRVWTRRVDNGGTCRL